MGKLVYNKIPVVKVVSDGAAYCESPVLRKYRSVLEEGYTLKEDIRGKMLGNLYLDRVIAVSGSYGIVVKAYDVLDKKYYAVKIMRPKEEDEEDEEDDEEDEDLLSEVEVFNLLSRYPNCEKNIVCLYDEGITKKSKKLSKRVLNALRKDPHIPDEEIQTIEGDYNYIKMELMSGDLRDFIDGMVEYQGEDWGEKYPGIVRKIILSIMKGLSVIHEEGLAHMDLKPENVLVKFGVSAPDKHLKGDMEPCDFYKNPNVDNLTIKVGDLGLVCAGKESRGLIQECWALMTPQYAPPEVISSWQQSGYPLELARKADIWSVGIILGELMFPEKYTNPITKASRKFWKRIADKKAGGNVRAARKIFLKEYRDFIPKLPAYHSDNKEFDEDISTIFRRMIHLDPKKRDTIDDLIVMLPPL